METYGNPWNSTDSVEILGFLGQEVWRAVAGFGWLWRRMAACGSLLGSPKKPLQAGRTSDHQIIGWWDHRMIIISCSALLAGAGWLDGG